MESFDMISSDSEEGLLDEIVVGSNNYQQKHHHHHHHPNHHDDRRHQLLENNAMQSFQLQQLPSYTQNNQSYHNIQNHQEKNKQLQQLQLQLVHQKPTEAIAYHYKAQEGYYYNTIESPIHYCDTAVHSDDNSTQENLPPNYQRLATSTQLEKLTEIEHSKNSSTGNINMLTTHRYQYDENYDHNDDDHDHGDNYVRSTATTAKKLALTLNNDDTSSTSVAIITESSDKIKSFTNNNNDYNDDVIVDKSTTKCVLLGQSLEMHTLNNIAPHANNNNNHHHHGNVNCGNTMMTLPSSTSVHHNQLTTDMCNYKNSKSRRLEYSLKCLKYGRSNPSQDSAFGSLTENDLSTGSSSLRLNSFQSISSPIDEGVEDIIIATTMAGKETCLELATIPRNMVSQDSAISSPCRENSPNNFLHIDDANMVLSGSCSGNSSSSSSTGNIRPQQFPVSLSPKILVTATTNSSNSSLSSINVPVPTPTQQSQQQSQQQQQQFYPPKILVNDQNSIYTTSPSKRTSTIEVFSQKYRVSSFEDMSPNRRAKEKHLRNVNRIAFRSLEEEKRIDSAFVPITERTHSDNRVNMQSEKYKKLTHSSFRISKTASQMSIYDNSPRHSLAGSRELVINDSMGMDLQRPVTAPDATSNRQSMWRVSKFYRKNRIAKSNDSLLEISPNHSVRLSPPSLRDNHYESCSSSGSRQSLNRGSSTNEINGPMPHNLGMGRYCSSKSEDLADSNDYLRVMDARKSYSERHLVTLTKLRQTAINNSTPGGSSEQFYMSEDDTSFNDDNNAYGYQYQYASQQKHQYVQKRTRNYKNQHQQQQHELQHLQAPHHYIKRPHPNQFSWSSCSINRLKTTNIKTTSLATLSCLQNLSNNTASMQVNVSQSTATTSRSAFTNSSSSSSFSASAIESDKKYNEIGFLSIDRSKLNTTDINGRRSQNITNNSNDALPLRQALSGAEFSRIFAMVGQENNFNEEKTPLLENLEMSPISAGDGDSEHGETL